MPRKDVSLLGHPELQTTSSRTRIWTIRIKIEIKLHKVIIEKKINNNFLRFKKVNY